MRLATRLGLEDKLKANADPSAGQLVIMKSSQLSAAQTAVKILKALSSLLLIVVVALYALAIYLAQGRRRLLLGATGASLVFVGLVIASLRRFLGGAIVDSLVKTEANKQPVRVIWAIETSVLRDLAVILVVYGALVLVVTVLAGPNRLAVAFRRSLAPSFRHHPIVVWVAALFVFLILLAVGPTAGNRQLLGVVILAATTAVAIEALRRETLREFPEDPHPAVGKTPGAT
jgi:MFS family permease